MNDSEKPVYFVVHLEVKDLDDFIQRYAIDVLGQLQKAGAAVLAAATPQLLEGELAANRTVVVRFPSMEVAKKWYDSEEYLPYKDLRLNELTAGGSAVFVEAFDPSILD